MSKFCLSSQTKKKCTPLKKGFPLTLSAVIVPSTFFIFIKIPEFPELSRSK